MQPVRTDNRSTDRTEPRTKGRTVKTQKMQRNTDRKRSSASKQQTIARKAQRRAKTAIRSTTGA